MCIRDSCGTTHKPMNFIEEHPFVIVSILSFIFMCFITKEDMRAIKHRKHQIEIEKKKKKLKDSV